MKASRYSVVEVKNLTAGYGRKGTLFHQNRTLVVRGLSFDIEAGQIVGLLGSNASGKTTILNALVDPSNRITGEVLYDRRPIRNCEIAYVPQTAAASLSPWLKAEAEIALSLRVRGLSRKQWQPIVQRLVGAAAISVPLVRRVDRLSGGQRVKVALLRAIAVEPRRLFIADEPFEGLDAGSRSVLIDFLRAEAENGTPIIVTSHRAEDLQALGAKVLKLDSMPVASLTEVEGTAAAPAQMPTRDARPATDSFSAMDRHAHIHKTERSISAWFFGTAGTIVGFILWMTGATLIANPGLLPGPVSVVRSMIVIISSQWLGVNLAATVGRAATGWLLANITGIPIGILLAYNRRVYHAAAPWMAILRSLPVFVLVAPAAGLFPRLPEAQRVFLIWLTLFVIALQAVSAAAAVASRRRVNIARAFGASHWFVLTRILPYESIAGIFAAVEVTLPLSLIVCLVLETFLIPPVGLGLHIYNHLSDSDLSLLFALIIWPALLIAVSLLAVRAVSRAVRYDL